MGMDACIYFKVRDGVDTPRMDSLLPAGFAIIPAGDEAAPATHECDSIARHYSPEYQRGPWPLISAVLMTLLNSPDIERVWYFGDSYWIGPQHEMTPERLAEYTAYFLAHGRRGYFGEKW